MKELTEAVAKIDNIINYQNEKYIIINSTIFLGDKYIFVINLNNIKDVKLLVCLNKLEEVNDIELIRKVLLQME